MQEFKYTPGPWFVDGHCDVVTEDGTVVSWTAEGIFETDEINANSQLMAAAPEMLEALQLLMAEQTGGNKSCGHNGFTCMCPYDKARTAIAKALGK
ncbi:hypothetical protein AAHV08_09115 [Klebsiella pneumoniae]|nr:hypothetical protein [Klebsiella pneumoniae]